MLMQGFLNFYSKELSILHRLLDSLFCVLLFNIFVGDFSINYKFEFKLGLFLISIITLNLFKLYKSFRNITFIKVFMKVITAWLTFLSAFSLFLFLLKIGIFFSRIDVFLWLTLFLIELIFSHLISRQILKRLRISGRNSRGILFCGSIKSLKKLFKIINDNPSNGLYILGWFDYDLKNNTKNKSYKNIEPIKNINRLETYINDIRPDLIIFSQEGNNSDINSLLNQIGNTTIPLFFMLNFFGKAHNLKMANIGEQIILQVYGKDDNFFGRIVKRYIDVCLSIMLIIFLFPLLIIIAILIKLTSSGPILFKQERYGLNGKKFMIYKFRTMKVSNTLETKQATKFDLRITKLGFFLRKFSLDELPQLLNVIEGTMSLVGPRPHAVEHNEYYRKFIKGYMQRHSFKPGMTGLAQIYGLR